MAVDLGNGSAARRQQWLQRDLERGADRDPAEASAEEPAGPRAARPADPIALSRLLPPSPRDPNAQRARWGRDPEGARRDPSPAGVRLPVEAVPAAPLSPQTTTPAAPRRSIGERPASTAYVGERPIDADWLNQRESALKALRAEYEAARAAAQATPGSGPGWIEDLQHGNPLRDLPASDNRARVQSPDGRTMVFSEDAFAAHFKAQQSAQPGSALKSLATSYGADAATLFAKQPTLWTLATKDHALNAGPPPPGRAMGDAAQLGLLDLYMADPQIGALIATYGGAVAPLKGPIAPEQVRLFGAERFAQLSRLNNAMGAVRSQYSTAMARAHDSGSGPGWSEQQSTVTTVGDNEQAYQTYTQQVTTRTFDPDAFTAWYIQQDGLAHKAFASFYGQSRTTYSEGFNNVGGESGESSSRISVANLAFDNPAWTLSGIGGGMRHTALRPININDTPRLHDRNAVGFDLEAGWVTHPSNIREKRDWLETVVVGAIVGVASFVSAGTLGYAAAGALGMTTTTATGVTVLTAGGMIVSAGVAGATASVVSGAISGNLTWKSVLQGMLAGGLTAGLMNNLGPLVASAGPAGTIALRTTVQGGIQALLGGKFKDGAIAGFASGLAEVAAANMESGIQAAVEGKTMTAAEAIAARGAARIVGSAIRALGNPNDPQYAFASSFLSDLMPKEAQVTGPTTEQVRDLYGPDGSGAIVEPPPAASPTPTTTPAEPAPRIALDDDGNLMPGIVDANASPQQQAAQLALALERQGLNADEALAVAADHLQGWLSAPQLLQPPSPEAASWSPAELQARIDDVERHLQQDLAAQQAREDSLLGADGLLEPTGGATTRSPVRPVLNGRADVALNAASDVAGLLQPLQELRGAIAELQTAQAEQRIAQMRQTMREAGVSNVGDGYQQAWVEGGQSVRDYAATAEQLQRQYDDFLADKRYSQSYGANWREQRIGASGLSVPQFEQRVLQVQQQAADAAYEEGKRLIATGQIPLKNGDYALTLGSYVDGQVRGELRRLGRVEGLPDSGASNVFAVNRRISGNGLIGYPDLRTGANTISDVSLTAKNAATEQLRRWGAILPSDVLIVRPTQIGGSYVIPRSTIQPIKPGGRGG